MLKRFARSLTPTTPRYRLPINVTEPLERNLSTAIRAVFAANAYTLLGDTLDECARSGLFGNKETNPDAFHDLSLIHI